MSSVPILCTRCLKLKDRKEYSKAQLKKKSGHVCLSCAMNAAQNSSVEKAKEKVVLPAEKPLPSRLFKPLSGPEGDKADKMTCLTMHQPWASLLVYGIKRAEGRGWNTDFRGRLWIHAAAKQPTPDQIAACEANYREIYRQEGEGIEVEFPKHYPTSALIGYVDVVDVLPNSQLRECNIPDTVAQEECGSPFVFLCQNYHRLVLPFSLSGEHKLWKMNPRDCKISKNIVKESVSPYPIDFYSIMEEYYRTHCVVC